MASIRAFLAEVKDIDAVVSCAGDARFAPIDKLTEEDFLFSISNKLLGQVNLVRAALPLVRDNGSITISSGILSRFPMVGSCAVSLVNAGLEGFGRAATLEASRGREKPPPMSRGPTSRPSKVRLLGRRSSPIETHRLTASHKSRGPDPATPRGSRPVRSPRTPRSGCDCRAPARTPPCPSPAN